jgi:dUTP pyrophosphatase
MCQTRRVKGALTDLVLRIEQMEGARDLPLPSYMSERAAGLDLRSAVESPVTLGPGQFDTIPTGMRISVPAGCEAQVRPRSGLAAKHGVTVLNTPGTIDADYRGEVCVILVNHGPDPFVVQRGERIAQLVVAPVTRVRLETADELDATTRGSAGFGHTGR